MKPFALARPKDDLEALSLLSATARPKGGGIDLMDLAKWGHPVPEVVVDVRGLSGWPMAINYVKEDENPEMVHVPSHATLAQIQSSSLLAQDGPVLADAAAQAATPQIRNVATLAGNLLQRPRCAYFRDPFFDCLKRGGRSCPAMEGEHAEGAVFGNSKCCATHPSNLAVALLSLDATVWIEARGKMPDGSREVSQPAIAEFFVSPNEDPLRENRIGIDELIRFVKFRPCPASAYVEVDQKQSFDWASASAAVALEMEGGKVKSARVALGAVAPVPLLSEAAAKALVGKVPDEAAAKAAGEAAVEGATPLRDNGHKVQHLRICVQRAVLKAAARGR
jgi:xanthine dehydrogenase YagS FAD-binding subunit